MLPTLHALWRDEASKVGITADECWTTKGGIEILDTCVEADRATKPVETSDPMSSKPMIMLGVHQYTIVSSTSTNESAD